MEQEQRREPRAKLEVEVNLESENNFYAGITGNVSLGGVFIATYTPPKSGVVVELDLALEGKTYHVRGIVCWVRAAERATDFAPAGVGLRWIDLPPAAEKAINHFVNKRDTILYDDD